MTLRPILVLGLLLLSPLTLAHDPPTPVTICQRGATGQHHDYLPVSQGIVVLAADGNIYDCGPNTWTVPPFLNDNASLCQSLKADPALGDVHALLCLGTGTGVSQDALDYDGELDHGYGGALLAVVSGDGITSGAMVCYGMQGHHSDTIIAKEWPDGSGPAFTVAADHSRTSPPAGPKGPRADCGDSIIEPCDLSPPPPSTWFFPVNVVIDTVNFFLYGLLGPQGNGTTCNVNDCAERNQPTGGRTTRSNPTGPSWLTTSCMSGIDGAYWVFIEPDLDAPDVPMLGHVWTLEGGDVGDHLGGFWDKGPYTEILNS